MFRAMRMYLTKETLPAWFSLFIIMMVMNTLTPLSVADDGAYAFVKKPAGNEFDDNRPIGTFSELVESMDNHWQTHNGRIINSVAESLSICFIGKPIFNVLNALIFCLTIGFFLSLCGYSWRGWWNWPILLLFIVLMPAFGETFLWVSGSCNYLWTAFFVLGFLLLMRRYENKKLSKQHWLLLPVAFICGWTHEILTLPVSMALGLYVLLHIRKVWGQAFLPLIIGFWMGTAMNILGPATFSRAGATDVVDVVGGVGEKLKSFAVSLTRLRVFWLFLFAEIIIYFRDRTKFVFFVKSQRWLLVITIFSLLVILLSGMSNERVRFGTELLSLMLVMAQLKKLGIQKYERAVQIASFVACVLLLIPILYCQIINYDNYRKILPQLEDRNQMVILTPTDSIPHVWRQYLVNHVAFGDEYAYYLACDKGKTMVRYMSAMYGKKGMFYFPKALYDDVVQNPKDYADFKTLPHTNLYVKRVDTDSIPDVMFILADASESPIPFYVRPFARWISSYSARTCHPTYKKVLELNGKKYLVIPAPRKEMAERVTNAVVGK